MVAIFNENSLCTLSYTLTKIMESNGNRELLASTGKMNSERTGFWLQAAKLYTNTVNYARKDDKHS